MERLANTVIREGRRVRDLCDDICAEARDAPRPVVILDLRGRTRFMDRTSCANLLLDKDQRNGSERVA